MQGPSTTQSFAYRAMLVVARSYVAGLVCVSILAAATIVLGVQAQIVGSGGFITDATGALSYASTPNLSPGDLLISDGTTIPYVGLPTVWLAEDQTWFTAWVIVTMIASMLSIPRPIKAFVGSNRSEAGAGETEPKPGVSRRLVVVSAWPLLLLLVATLPLA